MSKRTRTIIDLKQRSAQRAAAVAEEAKKKMDAVDGKKPPEAPPLTALAIEDSLRFQLIKGNIRIAQSEVERHQQALQTANDHRRMLDAAKGQLARAEQADREYNGHLVEKYKLGPGENIDPLTGVITRIHQTGPEKPAAAKEPEAPPPAPPPTPTPQAEAAKKMEAAR